MNTENYMPEWAQALFEAIASTIEFKGFANIEGQYTAPEESFWGVDVLTLAPAVMEIAEGPHDGEQCYGIVHNFDLLAVQEAFDEVTSLAFGVENDGRHCFIIEGKVNAKDVVVQIYTEPFADAEVSEIISGTTHDEP